MNKRRHMAMEHRQVVVAWLRWLFRGTPVARSIQLVAIVPRGRRRGK